MKSKAQDKETKRVGLWIRVSTEDQVKGESPEHHERRGRAYAESRDWEVVEVYRLEAVSGKSVMEHPDTKRMLEHVRKGHIEGLIFSKLARLARNTKELLEFSEIFQECGADLISLQESIDTSTPAGRLFYTVIAAMAQWEREEIAERVAASVPIRAKMGKSLGGQAPLGYQWVEQKLIPNPKEVPIRRRVYELFREHKRKKTVARLLNEAGYRTRGGKKFSDSTVERLLDDPTAKGWRRANYSKSLGPNKHWVYKPESEWIHTPVEPIVSEELWNECHQILEDQQSKRGRPAKKPVNLFAGLTICSCGQKMYVPSNSPKYTCYKCRNKIPIVDLEAIYYEQLKGFLLSPDEIAEYMTQANETLKEKEALLETLQSQASSVQTEMDRLYDLYIHGEIQRDGFGKRYHPLEEQARQLEDEIPRLQAEIDFLKINYLSDDRVLTDAQSLYTQWPSLEFEDRRSIVEAITEEIKIGDGDIEIAFCYLPSFKDVTDRQRNFIPALPFCHRRISCEKPKDSAYPKELLSLGDHLRKKRLDQGLLQKEVAERLGVDEATVFNWERNRNQPALAHIPRIIEFLGYNPLEEEGSLGERLKQYRKAHGISQKALARLLGVDPGTLARWERGREIAHADKKLRV